MVTMVIRIDKDSMWKNKSYISIYNYNYRNRNYLTNLQKADAGSLSHNSKLFLVGTTPMQYLNRK